MYNTWFMTVQCVLTLDPSLRGLLLITMPEKKHKWVTVKYSGENGSLRQEYYIREPALVVL